MGRWVTGSNLQLNPAKCKTMIVTRHRTRAVPVPELKLYGQALERVFEYNYLGVTLSFNLSWSPHIEKIVAKTRRLTGMLYRQLYQWSDPEALLKIYLSVIRPHLVYAAPVWSPDLIKDINKLEHVQKFALRVCTKSGLCHMRTCWRSAVYRSSLLGGITLVSASYIKSLMENASYRMLLSRHTLPPTPLALMKLISMSCLLRVPTCSRAHIFIVQSHCGTLFLHQ